MSKQRKTVQIAMKVFRCQMQVFIRDFSLKWSDIFQKTCRKCHSECVGCKEKGQFNCFQCRHYNQSRQNGSDECVASCSRSFYDAGDYHCQPCHSECSSCFGPTEYDCHACKNVRRQPTAEDVAGNNVTNNKVISDVKYNLAKTLSTRLTRKQFCEELH